MSVQKEIRVTSIIVQLIQLLGTILRDQLGFKLYRPECWTFEHVGKYEIPVDRHAKEPAKDASNEEWGEYDRSKEPEHEVSVYMGTGRFPVYSGNGVDQVEVRVRCEHDHWTPTGLKSWDIQMWVKWPTKEMQYEHFWCSLGYGTDCSISPCDLPIPKLPPRRFSFK